MQVIVKLGEAGDALSVGTLLSQSMHQFATVAGLPCNPRITTATGEAFACAESTDGDSVTPAPFLCCNQPSLSVTLPAGSTADVAAVQEVLAAQLGPMFR